MLIFTGRCRFLAQQLERDAASSVSPLCHHLHGFLPFLAPCHLRLGLWAYFWTFKAYTTPRQSLNTSHIRSDGHDATVGLRRERRERASCTNTQNICSFLLFMKQGDGRFASTNKWNTTIGKVVPASLTTFLHLTPQFDPIR